MAMNKERKEFDVVEDLTPAIVAFHWQIAEDAKLMMVFLRGMKEVAIRRQQVVVINLMTSSVAVASMADRIRFSGAVVLRGPTKRERIAWERQAAK